MGKIGSRILGLGVYPEDDSVFSNFKTLGVQEVFIALPKMSSEEIEGLGFAIPIDTAYEVILELIDHGYVKGRPALDFNVIYQSSVFGYGGVYVYDRNHDDVKYGDLIYAADGIEITAVSDLENIIQNKQVGDTLELTIYRSNQKMTVTVTLVEKIPETSKPAV